MIELVAGCFGFLLMALAGYVGYNHGREKALHEVTPQVYRIRVQLEKWKRIAFKERNIRSRLVAVMLKRQESPEAPEVQPPPDDNWWRN